MSAARLTLGFTQEYIKELEVTAAEAALELGDTEKLAELVAMVDAVPTGRSSHFLRAHSARFRAHLADRTGDSESADRLFEEPSGSGARSPRLSTLPSCSSNTPSGSPGTTVSTTRSRCWSRHARSSSGSARHHGSNAPPELGVAGRVMA